MASEIKYGRKHVLRTKTKIISKEVAKSYKLLRKVERAFKELKSVLIFVAYTITQTRG